MSAVQGSLFELPDEATEAPAARAAERSAPAIGAAPAETAETAAPAGPRDAAAVLAPWRAAGVLRPADVHLATTLARLAGLGAGAEAGSSPGGLTDQEALVVLGAALAARAPRLGHVCLDLATVRRSVPAEVEGDADDTAAAVVEALPWPADVEAWRAALAASPLVVERTAEAAAPGPPGQGVPLVLDGTLLYLERYRAYEDAVAAELVRRATTPAPLAPGAAPTGAGARLDAFDLSPEQAAAAGAGAAALLSVLVGGPGTGKTTTVAALLAVLLEHEPGARIALVAPTGKAAARMGESVAALAGRVRAHGGEGADALADRLAAAEVATIHRRLGSRPDGSFRHHAGNRLVHDVVIVDETSMVSLPLMAHLLDAVRPEARLVLVGDPGQLASVEAGSVLGDIAGPAVDAALEGEPAPAGPMALCVTVLTRSYRFPAESVVGRFAAAVRAGAADAAVAVLAEAGRATPPGSPGSAEPTGQAGAAPAGTGPAGADQAGADQAGPRPSDTDPGRGGPDDPGAVRLAWHPHGADTPEGAEALRAAALAGARATVAAARAGDAAGALDALGRLRVLCAHRRGPFGVAWWNWQFEQWLGDEGIRTAGTYVGRPLLVTANDPVNGVFNGDLGVVVADEPVARVAFPGPDGARLVAPARLDAVETVHAMTIHKSQGSEFDEVVVVLPPAASRLATRELLYTAVTRARSVVTLVGGEAALRRAVTNRVLRQSGLGRRLWPDLGGDGPARPPAR